MAQVLIAQLPFGSTAVIEGNNRTMNTSWYRFLSSLAENAIVRDDVDPGTSDSNDQIIVLASDGTLIRDTINHIVTLGRDESLIQISDNVVNISSSFHRLSLLTGETTHDVNNIYGGTVGQMLTLTAANDTQTIVLKDGTGNLCLAGDCTLDNLQDTVTLIYSAADLKWKEICRSNNGA